MSDNPPTHIWQELGRWHVQLDPASTILVFATQEEAIAYSRSRFTDGRSAARAETERGDVPLLPVDSKPRRSRRLHPPFPQS